MDACKKRSSRLSETPGGTRVFRFFLQIIHEYQHQKNNSFAGLCVVKKKLEKATATAIAATKMVVFASRECQRVAVNLRDASHVNSIGARPSSSEGYLGDTRRAVPPESHSTARRRWRQILDVRASTLRVGELVLGGLAVFLCGTRLDGLSGRRKTRHAPSEGRIRVHLIKTTVAGCAAVAD